MPTRRRFLSAAAAGGASLLLLRCAPVGARLARPGDPVRFGVCADVHQDIMHDAPSRLRVFIERMRQEEVDFIVQLGDFCVPAPRNRRFLETWRRFDGPRYHVIGNHDMDENHSREEVVDFQDMPGRYYSFDHGAFHFVVLDANDRPPGEQRPGYPCSVAEDQLAWLEKDLAATDKPTVVFSHQGIFEDYFGNADELKAILHAAVDEGGRRKVFVCINGHNHCDWHQVLDGLHYLTINSMSYRWLGSRYAHDVYDAETIAAHPAMRYTAPYEDSVYAIVTLDPAGEMHIEGLMSEWVGPSPWELEYPEELRERVVPGIRDRRIDWRKGGRASGR